MLKNKSKPKASLKGSNQVLSRTRTCGLCLEQTSSCDPLTEKLIHLLFEKYTKAELNSF